jgi:hypothetical protein
MMSFASAVDIDFDCPDEIFVDEEFECVLEVFDGSGEYDVKVDLDGERNSVLRVWNDGKWESGYYYLKEFIDDGDDEKIKMKVSDDGDFEGVVKLRQGDKREFFDIELEVEKGDSQSEIVGDSTLSGDSEDLPLGDSSLLDGDLENDVISLNDEVIEGGGFVYVSKDSEVVDWLPYGFSLFLIFVIVILVWERR